MEGGDCFLKKTIIHEIIRLLLNVRLLHICLAEKGINQPERNMDALDVTGCEAF
jgi:hypothetical protein